MKTISLSVLAATLCLTALASPARAARAGNPAPHEVAVFFEVEFADPMAWDCKAADTCLECRNASGGPSDVVVTHAPTGVAETHPIAAGLVVRICGNVVFLPHSD